MNSSPLGKSYVWTPKSNFQVVVLCAMLWALPVIWPEYQAYYHPYWSKYLLPFVQIALMSSVYCTIIMSWERYVRICLICRGCDYFSDGKFKGYMAFIIFFPVIFYVPKFFEVIILLISIQATSKAFNKVSQTWTRLTFHTNTAVSWMY